MKFKIMIVAISACLSVQAEDMEKYLDDTEAMQEQGKYEQALERHLWFHDHALEHDCSMAGVRLSFALADWKDLGDKYPPALTAMKKVRDEKTALLENGHGSYALFLDVDSLNETLGEEGKTIELFRKLEREQHDLAEECRRIVKKILGEKDPNDPRPDNELPMYGGLHNPTVEQNNEFSKSAVDLGWKYFYQGDLDTAIKRFNQGWMFNRENPDVYWGFGVIMGARASLEEPEKNLNESIRLLQMANEKRPEDRGIIGDLAFSHTILGHYYKSELSDDTKAQRQFREAEELFGKAFKIDPKYPPTLANWSILRFYTDDYRQAKAKADEAIKMGYKFSPEYIKDLEEKLK